MGRRKDICTLSAAFGQVGRIASMNGEELQERVCRCCDRKYAYPVKKSLATRFYCEACSQLSEETQAMFELFNKRIRMLTGDVEQLRTQLTERDKA